MYFIEICKRDGVPLPPDLLEQARRPAPDIDMRRKRKLKKKVVAENEEPRQKKKKIIIRNKGISISETRISDSVNIDPTINHTNIPTETPIVSEQTTDQHMTDAPEQNMSVPENTVSEQTVHVSENIIPDNNPSENIPSEKPEIITTSEPLEQQQHQKQQTQQHVFSENPDEAENIIFESPEHAISEPSESLPSPVFDDFSKTNFFSEIPVDETPSVQNNDHITENNSQIVPVLTENPTPLATLVDLTLNSDNEPISPHHSDTSSYGSSFNADEFVSELMTRKRTSVTKPTTQPVILSENRISVPPSFFASYPIPSPPVLPVT